MITPRMLSGFWVSLVLAGSGILPASAELASLRETPWLGYYAVFANGHYQFTVTSAGIIRLIPIGDKREPVAQNLAVTIQIVVEEIQADGKIIGRSIQPNSLESAQPATEKLEKSVISGKVTGDATFEVTIERSRGTICMGGRITNPGTVKNPLRLAFTAKFPPFYPKKPVKTPTKKEEDALQKKIAGDHIMIKGIDGKHRKQPFDKRVDASAELTGTGIIAAEVESSAYSAKGPAKKFQFTASTDSALTLKNGQGGPLVDGFVVRWEADKTKDPEGKARFAFDVK